MMQEHRQLTRLQITHSLALYRQQVPWRQICPVLVGQVSSLLAARDVSQVWAASQGAAELSWTGMTALMGG